MIGLQKWKLKLPGFATIALSCRTLDTQGPRKPLSAEKMRLDSIALHSGAVGETKREK